MAKTIGARRGGRQQRIGRLKAEASHRQTSHGNVGAAETWIGRGGRARTIERVDAQTNRRQQSWCMLAGAQIVVAVGAIVGAPIEAILVHRRQSSVGGETRIAHIDHIEVAQHVRAILGAAHFAMRNARQAFFQVFRLARTAFMLYSFF